MGACGSEFGEDEMKTFVRSARDSGEQLTRALSGIDAEIGGPVTAHPRLAEARMSRTLRHCDALAGP